MTHSNIESVDNLVGTHVVNLRGSQIGTITGLLADRKEGTLSHAVIQFEEPLDGSDARYAVPWSAMVHDAPSLSFVLDVDEGRLANISGFPEGERPDFTDAEWLEANRRQWDAAMQADSESGNTYFAGAGDGDD